MKKIMALLLLIFSFTLLSCNNDKEHNPTIEPTVTPTVEPTIEPTETPTVDPFLEYYLYNGKLKTEYENYSKSDTLLLHTYPATPYYDIEAILLQKQYLYEVSFEQTNEFVAIYADKEYFENLYSIASNNSFADVDLNTTNETIANYIFSKTYYDGTKVEWLEFDSQDNIPSYIADYICVNVFVSVERSINYEIFSKSNINLKEITYRSKKFNITDSEFLEPVTRDEINYTRLFFGSNDCNIDVNKEEMFEYVFYSNQIEGDTIIALTKNNLSEEELSSMENQVMANFYKEADLIMLESISSTEAKFNYNEYKNLLAKYYALLNE